MRFHQVIHLLDCINLSALSSGMHDDCVSNVGLIPLQPAPGFQELRHILDHRSSVFATHSERYETNVHDVVFSDEAFGRWIVHVPFVHRDIGRQPG